jgi:FlaA1/EpsC-like NDP-sugar epimerase
MLDWIFTYRRPLLVVGQLFLVGVANLSAFWIRFDGDIPEHYWHVWVHTAPWLLLVRGLIFLPFRLYEGFWRYTGLWDLRNILGGVVVSSIFFLLLINSQFDQFTYPRSILFIDAILITCLLAGVRLVPRIFRELALRGKGKRVLIYGAGDAGEMIVRDMKRHSTEYEPVGFIDDSPKKRHIRIHGVPVLGTREQLVSIVTQHEPEEVLVAIPTAEPRLIRQIVQTLSPFKVSIKTLPSLREILDGTVTVKQIRDLAIEDLLTRPPVRLDRAPVLQFVKGKRVLVTGAGGSIGSELCRQLAQCEPEVLILLDKAESALYDIDLELNQWLPPYRKTAFLADIKNRTRLHEVFVQYAPQIVFHAAAYKHVPMMEAHPEEGVLNNISGTRQLCEVAVQYSVETFVQISTDKAVNPTSVMGATKRVGELFLQALARSPQRGRTVFCAVRFGNVLGSNGSVAPLFLRQIKAGGPVTVTHPDITRYFMTIPEAVQLVLQAAPLAKGGEIFVLDMGEQVRVLDMARHLIRLSGFIPDEEIPIVFTSLRPGEKLYEELVGADETIEACSVEKIQRVRPTWFPEKEFLTVKLDALKWLAEQGETQAILLLLCEIVPTFHLVGQPQPRLSTISVNGQDVAPALVVSALQVQEP